jgi:two-component system nitrate/nitrite response regulator NarL
VAIKVGVLEDDNLTRLTLSAALEAQGFEVPVSASRAQDFLRGNSERWLDAALLDVHLGSGPTGIDVAIALREKHADIGIVFLTSFEDPRLLNPNLPELPAGSRYLTKLEITNIAMLQTEIELALAGAQLDRQVADGKLKNLTDAQIETLRLVALGLSNSEIAKRRFVTEKSIETTISRMAKALGVAPGDGKNLRVQLARAYFKGRGLSLEGGD